MRSIANPIRFPENAGATHLKAWCNEYWTMDQVTLATLVPVLPSFDQDDEMVIYMRQPWSLSSECMVFASDARERASQAGFDYFLEVAVALEVLEGYAGRDLSLDEQSERLLFYAENDAFLD